MIKHRLIHNLLLRKYANKSTALRDVAYISAANGTLPHTSQTLR